MHKKYKIALLILCIAVIGVYFYPQKIKSPTNTCVVDIKVGNTTVHSRIAKTMKEREQGLSGTPPLLKNEGMLFVFDFPDTHGFWMKDMNYPLDIIWFDENNKISFVKKNFTPESFPRVESPTIVGSYVLEVSSGFFDMNNLNLGDLLEIPPSACL